MEKEKNILDKMRNENPFSVPEGYFESFPAKMRARIAQEETAKNAKATRKKVFLSRFTAGFSIAASVALALLVGKMFMNNATTGFDESAYMASNEQVYDDSWEMEEYDSWIAYLDESTQTEIFLSNIQASEDF